jgi:hypothetical protein
MTNTKSLPSIDYLRKRLRYEPDTGKLFWLDHEGMSKQWRTRYAGKEALTANTEKGYLRGRISTKMFKAHRVAWALYYGVWPSDQIDHLNGIPYDNRIINLRVVSNQDNNKNKTMRSDNTSGVTGVHRHKPGAKWRAYVKVNGRTIWLGSFDTIEEAAAARKEADIKYGFTERHGTKAEEVE